MMRLQKMRLALAAGTFRCLELSQLVRACALGPVSVAVSMLCVPACGREQCVNIARAQSGHSMRILDVVRVER